MALLETELYPITDPLIFNYGFKDLYSMVAEGGAWEAKYLDNHNWEASSPSVVLQNVRDHEWDIPNSSSNDNQLSPLLMEPPKITSMKTNRRKRRRTKSSKNQEEIENQRITHIAVERNRRKQMNHYLSILRSLMPSSYVQRGDQASIIGGAINFLKELEQMLQSIEGHKKTKQQQDHQSSNSNSTSPLAEFFTFPRCSTRATQYNNSENDSMAQNQNWAVAEIEVTMMDSHANLKILTKKRPRQLLKMVIGFQCLLLSILHLNLTTVDQMVLYSVSVKIEEGCQLNTVDEIAAAFNQMMRTIQQDHPAFS